MRKKIDKFTSRILRYIYSRFEKDHRRHRPLEIVYERASEQSADFILANLDKAVLFDSREAYWRYVVDSMPPSGLVMECGVFEGLSINFIADRMGAANDRRTVYGFDSFQGLEEDWAGENLPAGFFDMGGRLPQVRQNVQLIKGWVQDTVAPFLADHPSIHLALLHIDTDTYTPARFLLDVIRPRLTEGSIIAFDELIGYPNWINHEYRALIEAIPDGNYEFIAFTSRQAAIRIKAKAA